MGRIRQIYRKIRGRKEGKKLEQELENKSVNYLLRDRFQNFLDLLYKKDIDQYSKVKGVVRDFTDLSSALIHGNREQTLDFIFERVFPGFLLKLIDESLHSGMIEPILDLKKQVIDIWQAYDLQQLKKLELTDSSGYLPSIISLVDNKESDDLETTEEDKESEVKQKKINLMGNNNVFSQSN